MALRSWHRRVARVLAAALLFTQGAMVAHACKTAIAAEAPVALPTACAEHHVRAEAGALPDRSSPADVQVCKAHCDQAQTTVGAKFQIDTSAIAASIVPMPWFVLAPAASAPVIAVPRNTGPPLGTPPLYIAYAVLRR